MAARLHSEVSETIDAAAGADLTDRLPVVAIVGRPNVGKSTLFNRLVRAKKAIVDDHAGVTRDRNYGTAEWGGRRFLLVDTGGLDPEPESGLKEQIQGQSRRAIDEADVIVFLLDGKVGLNPLDRDVVKLLRQQTRPVVCAVNKIDSKSRVALLYEFYALGLGEIFPVSAEHGIGLSPLMDRVVGHFPGREIDGIGEKGTGKPVSVAIVGRPNVGKSTLVNRLLGYERSIVDPHPGTTRDAVDSPFSWEGQDYIVVDTAGIRRKARITDEIERSSVLRALRSVDRGDLLIYLLDGLDGVTGQDAQILAYAHQRGKGLILAVNKWDLVPRAQRDPASFSAHLYARLAFLDFAPVVFVSALAGQGIRKMMGMVRSVSLSQRRWLKTSTLNQALQEVVKRHHPPPFQGREVKFYYGVQTAVGPPTFTLFVNFPRQVPPSYERYLVHQLRSTVGLEHTPIRLVLRARREQRSKGRK